MANQHHHHDTEELSDRRLLWAIVVNIGLTLAQVVGGIIANSLALIADALHNFSDAASLGIVVIARKISRKPPDRFRTFGYKRAELIAALINLTTLIVIGLYLVFEAVVRFFRPEEVAGWMVVIVAGIALLIDVVTAMLTYKESKTSLNVKAAFLHNLSDALSSLGVIFAAIVIVLFGWYWMDALLTLLIAGYVLYQGFSMMPKTIHILMEGTPEHIHLDELVASLEALDLVDNVHHVHVWQLDERRNAIEAHVVVRDCDLQHIEAIKERVKKHLHDHFQIAHSTIEIEIPEGVCDHGK